MVYNESNKTEYCGEKEMPSFAFYVPPVLRTVSIVAIGTLVATLGVGCQTTPPVAKELSVFTLSARTRL